jgi:maltose alpha-D-glucosyltransferase/alpha-amylase
MDAGAALLDDPLWYKDAIIYQTHVKAFSDTDGDGVGDFRGLTQKLDYIRDLGVNAVWLLPFFPSPMRDDGYDIAHYRNIYPPYGTRRDFRRFVRAAHRRGIRVIIELVINHTSDQHPWFQAARQAPKGSKKRDFYVWSDDDRRFPETRIIFTDTESSNWAWDPVAQQYYWHRFFSHQPDLNHNNPQVVKAVIRVMRFWLDMGVDGLRLDAIPYLCVRDGTNNENLPETHAVIREMRKVVDDHYANRMFLAEANQWPEDVREYFGDGDECHVAYHFPLMPRMYMALAQEDRHPIVEILEQTPEIPPNCQWAVFLRNHDELTLEMVSDRERDYMYQTYAADPRMRVNVGIRRRLAPLLENDRDKIRLMHSLLLSMPGSPILYYGDELGMGDNIYLGDRNGVRTPMQWSPDRNAGFSRADPQQLYLPPIMDPLYGYQSVNVEAQQRDAASLLSWMRRIIEVRKAHPVFGRGALSLLHPGNRKILAYVREGGEGPAGEAVLCVANLARAAQPVELDLSRFRGRVPIELLGQTAFPPIGELPYLLTLTGHGFYWFLLSEEAQAPAWHEERLPALKLGTLVMPEGWASLQPQKAQRREPTARALALLEGKILPAYLPTRRWYGAKGTHIERVVIRERQEWEDRLLTLVRVESGDGAHQDHFLPLGIVWEGRDGEDNAGAAAAAALARVRRHADHGLLCDAFAEEGFARALVRAIGDGREAPFGSGRLVLSPTLAYGRIAAGECSPGVYQLTEGLHSGAVIDHRFFIKGYRRLTPGANPEVEMGHFLTEVSLFPRIAPLAGSVEYRDAGGAPVSLAVLQGYVPNQGDLWRYTLELLERLSMAYGDRSAEWESDPAQVGYAALLEMLGRRVGELHLALVRPGGGDAFDPEPIQGDELERWGAGITAAAEGTLERLARQLEDMPTAMRITAEALCARRDELTTLVAQRMPGRVEADKIRCHGNLHLGHVLVVENDVVIIDFEGRPGRCLNERRAKQCPLADVAAIVHSLGHAARTVAELPSTERRTGQQRVGGPLEAWAEEMTRRLLRAYDGVAAGSSFYPQSGRQVSDLIKLFGIQKALEQVRDSLENRREGLGSAVAGALAVLDRED